MIKALWTVAPPTSACRKRCSRPQSRPLKQLPRWVLPLSRLLHNCEISWPDPAVWILVWHWFSGIILQNIWVASSLYAYHNVSLACVRCQFEAEMHEKCVSLFVCFFIFKFPSVIVLSQRFHQSSSHLGSSPIISLHRTLPFVSHRWILSLFQPQLPSIFTYLQSTQMLGSVLSISKTSGPVHTEFKTKSQSVCWHIVLSDVSIHWPLTLNPTWVRTFVRSLRINIFRHSLLASSDCCPNWAVTILAS